MVKKRAYTSPKRSLDKTLLQVRVLPEAPCTHNSKMKRESLIEFFPVIGTLCVLLLGLFLGGEQFFARYFGGHQTIELEKDMRLQTITWRKGDMWLLTYKDANVPPREYTFQEDSMLNVLEGTVTIIEK